MTWNNNDLELYFLDDNNIDINTATSWADYRNNTTGIVWRKWGKRPTNSGQVGIPASFADSDSINDANSMPIYFLRGKYLNTVSTSGGPPNTGDNMNKDYIVGSDDINLSNHPFYQYTWIAIQNRNTSGDACLRFGCSPGKSPDNWDGISVTGGDSNPLSKNADYLSTRWMGIIDGSNESALVNFKNNNATFPHKVNVQQRNSGGQLISAYNWWDAMGVATANKKVYYGYNNLQSYDLIDINYPWQINRWVQINGSETPPDRSEHCMDIPAGKTLVGIAVTTKDQQYNQLGNSTPYVDTINNFGWKYCELDCKYDYLVIS